MGRKKEPTVIWAEPGIFCSGAGKYLGAAYVVTSSYRTRGTVLATDSSSVDPKESLCGL